MAVTKIWPIKGRVDSPLNYVANEAKSSNPNWDKTALENLTDVMHYAEDGEKTEKQFFVTGINCSPEIARDQFVTVKKQFNKEDGIVAYHGYQSFAEGEVTPEEAHAIGLEFANRVWGKEYQVVVATHLNTRHIHNHLVINSISFKHGKRLRAKQWYELNKVSDEICREHGLSTIDRPCGKAIPKQLYEFEKSGGNTRLNIAKRAVDEAVAISTNVKELELVLKSMGYTCNFNANRKHWTIKLNTWKKPLRLKRIGEEYTNQKIMERLTNEKELKGFVVFQKAIYVKRQYKLGTREQKIKTVGGIKGLYLYYCYLLGYLPKYNQNPVRVSPLLRDDLIKMDKIADEARLLCKEKITTVEEISLFKEGKNFDIETKIVRRSELNKLLRRKEPKNKITIRNEVAKINEDLKKLRKEVRTAENIEERYENINEKINKIEKEEVKKDERRR